MLIKPEPPPTAAPASVSKVLIALAKAHGFNTPKLRDVDPASLEVTRPHRTAGLPLTSLGRDRPAAVVWRGWRFIITDNEHRPLASVEFARTDTGEFRFAELNEGRYVAATADLL